MTDIFSALVRNLSFACTGTKPEIIKLFVNDISDDVTEISFCRKIALIAKKEIFRFLKTIFSVIWFRCFGKSSLQIFLQKYGFFGSLSILRVSECLN